MTGLAEHLRLFTAVLLEAPLKRAIREEADVLLDGTGKLGRVREENLHVTLKFIGDVHRDDLGALDETLASAGRRLVPGEIEVAGVGTFPDLSDPRGRPRVIWAGVSDPSGILGPVHARLNETLAVFGAKREKKRYVPHVTLARVRGRFDARLLLQRKADRQDAADEIWMGTQAVGTIALMMSELERGRPPAYTVMGQYGPQAREARQDGDEPPEG